MSGTVVTLVPPSADEKAAADARRLLEEAIEMAPVGVIVFCYLPDHKIWTNHSAHMDVFQVVGALECAKKDILR